MRVVRQMLKYLVVVVVGIHRPVDLVDILVEHLDRPLVEHRSLLVVALAGNLFAVKK